MRRYVWSYGVIDMRTIDIMNSLPAHNEWEQKQKDFAKFTYKKFKEAGCSASNADHLLKKMLNEIVDKNHNGMKADLINCFKILQEYLSTLEAMKLTLGKESLR